MSSQVTAAGPSTKTKAPKQVKKLAETDKGTVKSRSSPKETERTPTSTRVVPKTKTLTVSEMVINAVGELNDRKGSSLHAIKKQMAALYLVDVERLSSRIRNALNQAVEAGSILQTTGQGASGSFKLPPKYTKPKAEKIDEETDVKKAPAAKKPATKKLQSGDDDPKESDNLVVPPSKSANPKKLPAARKASKPKTVNGDDEPEDAAALPVKKRVTKKPPVAKKTAKSSQVSPISDEEDPKKKLPKSKKIPAAKKVTGTKPVQVTLDSEKENENSDGDSELPLKKAVGAKKRAPAKKGKSSQKMLDEVEMNGGALPEAEQLAAAEKADSSQELKLDSEEDIEDEPTENGDTVKEAKELDGTYTMNVADDEELPELGWKPSSTEMAAPANTETSYDSEPEPEVAVGKPAVARKKPKAKKTIVATKKSPLLSKKAGAGKAKPASPTKAKNPRSKRTVAAASKVDSNTKSASTSSDEE